MKIRFALLAVALVATQAIAGTATNAQVEPALSKARLSGSLTAGYSTNYTGRGYVVSHSVAQGDSVFLGALKLNYDMGRKDLWSIDSTIAYTAPASGHTLYGNPAAIYGVGDKYVKNEFALVTAAKYKRPEWNVSVGHDFVHGGLLGVMARHFRGQGSSCVNELFVAPEWTPTAAPWFAAGIKTSFSFQGIDGWWFEPYVSFKAPIIGTPDNVKLAGILTFSLSATAEYFNHGDFACNNGTQAFWIKLATPWFVTEKKNIIITPSVSFNWLGKGGMKANENSHFRMFSTSYVPFREFGVVGGVSVTYTF